MIIKFNSRFILKTAKQNVNHENIDQIKNFENLLK
jgi:hypothetical protein